MLVDTLSSLVRIPSVNTAYPNGTGEAEIALWIETFLRSHGIETARQPVMEGRWNLIATLPGLDRTRSIVFEAHMDTVAAENMSIDPFEARIDNGRIYGRGSCDTKAGLAAMMCAMVQRHQSGSPPAVDCVLAAVVDEEYSFRGVLEFCDQLKSMRSRVVGAVVAEPTELQLVTASKGVLRWRIEVTGRAAHSAKCHLGANAVYAMSEIIGELEAEHERLQTLAPHALLGNASINVGLIEGGVQVNLVPDRCWIEIDHRLLPDDSVADVLQRIHTLVQPIADRRPGCGVIHHAPYLVDPAWSEPSESPWVTLIRDAMTTLNLDATPTGVPFGSDASKLGRAGIPTILFGPGSIDRAHTAAEYVELDQLEKAYQMMVAILDMDPSKWANIT
jgi:acetylornithine deacetylase/succinyl-diaminopimelate desuccinylase family protein